MPGENFKSGNNTRPFSRGASANNLFTRLTSQPTLADSLGKELKTILAFVGVIWAVYFISFVLPVIDYGMEPRTAWGCWAL